MKINNKTAPYLFALALFAVSRATGMGIPGAVSQAIPANHCGSANPALGYGPAPYGGSWATDHRDGRNSDFADCEVGQNGYGFTWATDINAKHTSYVYPTISPNGTAWVTVNYFGQENPNSMFLYGVDITTGAIVVQRGVPDGLNYTISWNSPVIDLDGNLYITQELDRPPGTPCRFDGEALSEGKLCGELISYDPQGVERWRIPVDGSTLGLQLTSDGKLVFQTWRGTIYIADPAPGLSDSERILSAMNAFPAAAATLPDDANDDVSGCISTGTGDSCIAGNIIAIHPDTDAIYNTVQGFVNGSDGFLQRWVYDAQMHTVTLDSQWDTAANLPGGSATSPDISFDGNTLFVSDYADSVHALDAVTGAVLASVSIGYSPAGSTATAPEVDTDGSIIGTYLMPYGPYTKAGSAYINLLRYRTGSGFETLKVFDGSDSSGIGWLVERNPIGGLVDRTVLDARVQFLVTAQKECVNCDDNGEFYLLIIDAKSASIISSTHLAVDGVTGFLGLAPDGSVISATKGVPERPLDSVFALFHRYDALAQPLVQIKRWKNTQLTSARGPAMVVHNDNLQILARGGFGDSSVYYRNALNFTQWQNIGGATKSEPAAVSFNGALWGFIRGMDDAVYVNINTVGSWSGWTEVPGGMSTASAPDVAVYQNELYLFVRGSDDHVHYNRFDGISWSGWTALNGDALGAPGVAVHENVLHLIVLGDAEGKLFYRSFDGTNWSSTWEWLPGTSTARPELVSHNGYLWVFVRGSHNQLYHTRLRSIGGWRPWADLNVVSKDAPGTAVVNGKLYIGVRGVNNSIHIGNTATSPK